MPIIELQDKNMVIAFPDYMPLEEIERAIYTDIYNQPVISQAPEPSFFEKATGLLRGKEPTIGRAITEEDIEAFKPAEIEPLAVPAKPYKEIKEKVLTDVKDSLKPPKREKGLGYFGELTRPDGMVSTELSIGINIDGKETEIPSLVPTLTKEEINHLLAGNQPTEQIVNKAVVYAKGRMAEGKSPFAQEGEQVSLEPAEPAKAEFTMGRLGQQALRGAAQGFADILRTIKAAEEQREIEEEAEPKGVDMFGMPIPPSYRPTLQEQFHMKEWIQKQEKKPSAEQIEAEQIRYRKKEQKKRIGILKKGIEAFPKELPKTSGIIEDAVKGMSRFLPSMGVSVVSPIAGAAIVFTQILGMEYDEMVSQGVDKERAFDAAVVSSLMQTPVEMAGNLLQIGVLKNLARSFKVSGKISTKVIQFFEAMGKGTLAEGTEEFIQQYPAEFSKIWAANPDLTPKELSEEFVNQVPKITKRGLEAAKVGAVGGALLAGTAGAAIQVPLAISEYVSEKQKQKTKEKEEVVEVEAKKVPEEPPRIIKRDEITPEDIADIQTGKAKLEEEPEITPTEEVAKPPVEEKPEEVAKPIPEEEEPAKPEIAVKVALATETEILKEKLGDKYKEEITTKPSITTFAPESEREGLRKTKNNFFTNGHWVLSAEMLSPALKKRIDKFMIAREAIDDDFVWKDVKKEKYIPATYLFSIKEPDYTNAVFRTETGITAIFNEDYVSYLQKNIPAFSLEIIAHNKPAVIKSGNKTVGVLMPVRLETGFEDILAEAKEGKVAPKAEKKEAVPEVKKEKVAIPEKKAPLMPSKWDEYTTEQRKLLLSKTMLADQAEYISQINWKDLSQRDVEILLKEPALTSEELEPTAEAKKEEILSEFMGAFDKAVEEAKEKEKPLKVGELAPRPTLKEKAKETKEHLGAIAEGFKKINEILGETGAISEEQIDIEKYNQIRPILADMWFHAKEAGKSATEFSKLAFEQLGEKGRGYFQKFVKEDVVPEMLKEKKLTKEEKKTILKEKEVAEGEKVVGPLREPGERPLEGAPPEYVPGPEEERAPGEGAPPRPRADLGADVGSHRERHEGIRGMGAGEGTVRPSTERRGSAELGRQHASGRNYRISDGDALEEGGEVAKFERNVAAIKLLKEIEGENRQATPEEQAILVKYSGWGGLAQNAFDTPASYRKEEAYTPWNRRANELQALLTEEEYEAARKSTPNAHFTSPLVINYIYDALNRIGFNGGRIIEPSMGIGHFFGRMPGDWKSQVVGIEIDSLSGRIAKLLYPDADVRVQGYETTKLPNNFFDLGISNVPFGDYKLYDPEYAKLKFFIHDYFFAKTLDKVRPGGMIAFITSSGMMNKKDNRIRRYIAERAELIAAIRLPNNAFKKIANTEVTTDIVFLRKLNEGEKPKGHKWLETKTWEVPTDYGGTYEFPINEYFHKYPHMQLGKVVQDKLHYNRAGLESDGRDLDKALAEAIEIAIPVGLYEEAKHEATVEVPKNADIMVPPPDHIKNYGFFEEAGKIYQKKDEESIDAEISKGQVPKMKKLIKLRDKVRETLHNQLENKDDLLESDLKELNSLYDTFVKKYGPIHLKSNNGIVLGDPDRPLLLSLENWNSDTKIAIKTDIFRQRTMAKYEPVEKVDTAQDALIATIFDRGYVDFTHMSKISGRTQDVLKQELKGLIFLNPEQDKWQTAEEYLSGNVRAKLIAAKAAAEIDPKYKANIEALEKAQPEEIKPSRIEARLGANWVPEQYLSDFLKHLVEAEGYQVRYVSATSAWVIEEEKKGWGAQVDHVANEQKWGIPNATAIRLIGDILNGKSTIIYAYIDDKKIVDRKKTLLAQVKQDEIKEEFEKWIWKDTERRDNLAKIFNEKFNNIRLRKYNGSHLPDRLPGMAVGVSLRANQKDNIWRIVQGKNSLLAQVVGSGKTLSMAGAATELRRLGLAKKPLFVVPKHLLKSWESEFLKFYPAAKILIPEEKSLTPEKRAEFMARISTGDWDAVIITHPNMMKLPMTKKAQNDFIRSQIEELDDAIRAEETEGEEIYGRRRKSKTVKELEKSKRRLEEKLLKILKGGEKDDTVTFEELGIDYMFIDESHHFKNLMFPTRMTRVPGITPTGSDKAMDLFLKSRYLTGLNNGRGVVFATGTPLTNSIAEMYTLQRYLDMDALKELDIHNFDAWAATFGEIAVEPEVTVTGAGFRMHARFRNFVNMVQLSTLFRDFADILHAEDVPFLPVPRLADGKPKTLKADISPEQKAYINTLTDRLAEISSGRVDPKIDNALKVTTDGNKCALDMRLIDPKLPDNPDSKVNLAVSKILDIYKSTKEDRLTQLVFCDYSVPRRGRFNVYDDVKKKLIDGGVSEDEITFIHDYPKDEQKLTLFQKVRQGDIRILMGSTDKMGEGVNIQDKLIAVHHLDAPWTPAKIEQRDGRMIRPGNNNPEVTVNRYVTQSTFDAYRWQLLENKAKWIEQGMKGGLDTVEDIGQTVIDYATAKAIASDNPIIMEKVRVDSDLRKYEAMQAGWKDQRYETEREVELSKTYLKTHQKHANDLREDVKARKPKPEDKDFSVKFFKNPELGIEKEIIYTDKKEAGKQLVNLFSKEFEGFTKGKGFHAWVKEQTEDLSLPLFSYRGFDVKFKQHLDIEFGLQNTLSYGNSAQRLYPNKPENYADEDRASTAYIQVINNNIDDLDTELKKAENVVERNEKNITDLTKWLTENTEFEYLDKVKELKKRSDEIFAQLSQTNKEPIEEEEEEPPAPGTMAMADISGRRRIEAIPLKLTRVPEGSERSNIIEKISHRLELPIRVGRFRAKKGKLGIGGIYKPEAKVARIKKANDVEVALHEVGHHIQNLLGFPAKMPKEVMKLAYKGAKNKSQEGFAEFVRFYVTNQEKAQREAPDFYRVFEATLAKYSDIQDVIVQAREAWEQWVASPSVAKVSSFIVEGNDRKQLPTMNELYTWIVDEIRPLQVLNNNLKQRTGVSLRASENPYLLATYTRGWARKAEQYLRWQPFQLKEGEGAVFQGESLYDIIAPIEKEGKRQLLSAYLVAKRAIHDPRILKGFEGILSKEDFEQTVEDLEPQFKETAEKLYEYSDNLIEFLVDSGRISQKLADRIKEKNLFYAPLYRLMDGEASLKSLSRTKYANLFNPIKRLKGSSRDIHDPIESIMYNTYAMINIAERNRVGEALIKISKIEGMGEYIEQLPFPVKPIKMKSEEALRAIAKDQGLDLDTFIADFGLDEVDLDKVLLTFRPNYNPQKGEVIFYERGEPRVFMLDKDLYAAVLSMNKESLSTLTQIASLPAKWLRAGATRFSPEFAIRNPARDQMTAFLYTKYNYIPPYDFLKGAFHITAKSKDWQEFNASGAAHATLVSIDRNYLDKNLHDLMRKGVKNIPHMVKHPLEAIQIVSELFEEGTRMGEFLAGKKKEAKKVKKGEQTELDALLQRSYAARDITLDFQKLGLKTRAMNAITAFFQAQINGVDKMVREFKNHPLRTSLKVWFGITLPSLLLFYAQKDDPIYGEIPTWRRIAFWNIITYPDGRPEKLEDKHYKGKFEGVGGFRWELNIGDKRVHIWSIPKPFEPGILFGSVPELALDWHYSKDPEGFKETLRALVESTTPSFIPTILVGPIEWLANRMLFFDRPVVPRGKEELEPKLQYTPYTSETIKLLAEAMSKVPGLTEYASPAKIQNLIRGYTGGAGRIVLEGIDSLIERVGLIDVPPEPSMTIADVPGIRAFAGRFPTANTRSIETFYKRYMKRKRKWESAKEQIGIRGFGIKVPKPQKLIDDEAIAKALSIKRKVIKLIYKNEQLDPKEKRRLMNDNYWDMINLARYGLNKSLIARSPEKERPKAVNE